LSDEYNGKLIFSMLPVIDFNIDFIIIMFIDESGMIEEQGIRITKNYLEALNTSIEENNDTALENQNPPFPIEIKEKYLKPFKCTDYTIKKRPKDIFHKYELLFLHLWEFSRIRLCINNEDGKFEMYIKA